MSWVWPVRRRFWNALVLFKYRSNKPATIPPPPDGMRPIKPVSLAERIPGLPIPNIRVADHIPKDEASTAKYWFYQFQVAMYRWFPAQQDGLPPVGDDPHKVLDDAYTAAHRRLFPAPILPAEYEHPDLGELAVASPYACALEKGDDGQFQWNLDVLDRYEVHTGLLPIGVHVNFRVDEGTRKLRVVDIDCELGRCRPGDPDWPRAQQLALCGVTTHVSLARHYNGVHLASTGPLALVTRNRLPVSHPLMRLLWPHIHGTQYSNHITTQGQMVKGGDFESIFSLTHRGMCTLFEESYDEYDAAVMDPALYAEQRGIVGAGFDTPALDNHVALFDVFRRHAARYLGTYYGADSEVAADEHVQGWIDELDHLVPGGIKKLLDTSGALDALARLVAAFIYVVTVQHEALGTGLWNYQMWNHVQPVRMYKTGQRVPVDVYQRLVNANFLLNVHRAPLVQDFSYLALDPPGADAFRQFHQDLQALQDTIEQEAFACWKISPKILEANINA